MITCTLMAEKLRPFAEKFGIKIECIDEIRYEDQSPFDQNFGLNRKSKTVLFVDTDNERVNKISASLIHELGHLLFDDPVDYDRETEEFEWFGWEWELAKKLDVEEEWKYSNKNYIVTKDNDEFGFMTKEEQDQILNERKIFAQQKGYLDTLAKL